MYKLFVIHVPVHDLHELLVRFNGPVHQFIYQVCIAQVKEYIRRCGGLFITVLFVFLVDVLTCFQKVFNRQVLLIGIIQQASSNLIFQVVVCRVHLEQSLIKRQCIRIFLEEEPRFGIEVHIAQ